MPRKNENSQPSHVKIVKRQHQVNSSSAVVLTKKPPNVITTPSTGLSGHYKPIGNNSNAIVNRLPPPHPSSTGVPPVPPSVTPPKTSSSSNSFVRNNRMISKNGSFNAGKSEEIEHIYESLDIKKSKLPSQNAVGYFITYF